MSVRRVLRRPTAPPPGWTVQSDVVAIGSGIAGLTAALRLADRVDRTPLDTVVGSTRVEGVPTTIGRAALEASGGLTLERAREVAETGVDLIPVGVLPDSVQVVDLGRGLQ